MWTEGFCRFFRSGGRRKIDRNEAPCAAPSSLDSANANPNHVAFPLLLVTFPAAVAVAGTPLLVGLVCAAFLTLAGHFRCLKGFTLTLGIAFLLNACVLSGFAIFCDADNYHLPLVRILAGGAMPSPEDGSLGLAHLRLPLGFAAWGAALYRLTGWTDAGNSLVFLLLPAAWSTLRESLTRLQTALLVFTPLTFLSMFNAMPDGPLYLLLLTALFALRQGRFWLALLSAACTATLKTSAWVPCLLIALALLRDFPAKWWKIALIGAGTTLCVLSTLRAFLDGSLEAVSTDFLGMDTAAREMGFWARQVYAYLGHGLIPGVTPGFNVPVGGADGGGVDGLGPFFRVAMWGSLATLVLGRRKLAGWGTVLLIAWGSMLTVPTLYVGYARYVPLVYVAVMLPLVLCVPRLAVLPALLVCAMPLGWMGWRFMLSTENVHVWRSAETVHSGNYNVRCAFRKKLVEQPQPTLSGSLMYTYRSDGHFPAIPRSLDVDNRLTPAAEKAKGMAGYAFHRWLPWAVRRLPNIVVDTACYRLETFLTFPRGASDGIPPPATR